MSSRGGTLGWGSSCSPHRTCLTWPHSSQFPMAMARVSVLPQQHFCGSFVSDVGVFWEQVEFNPLNFPRGLQNPEPQQ